MAWKASNNKSPKKKHVGIFYQLGDLHLKNHAGSPQPRVVFLRAKLFSEVAWFRNIYDMDFV